MTVSSAPRATSAPSAPSAGKTFHPPATRKFSGLALAGSVAGRFLNPGHLWTAIQLQRGRKANRRSFDDAQLALYSRILPGDFLHYGYFDDTDRRPEDITLADINRAQNRYAELLLELALNKADPVLDVGCGMGGLSRILRERGYSPTALTPDRLQAAHVGKTLPDVPVIRSKFEELPAEGNAGKFGTVFTSESLQYLKLDRALPLMETILKPGGRWIASDYFKTHPSADRTCHEWEEFVRRLDSTGWKIVYQRDITPNVLPTLAYLHMWAVRFGIPLMDFAALRLRRKQPGLHHLLLGALGMLEKVVNDNVGLIDPVRFAADRQYMMLAMERKQPGDA